MCYSYSNCIGEAAYRKRFRLEDVDGRALPKLYYVSAFTLPAIPVITDDAPKTLQLFRWGLIPHWAKDSDSAEKMRFRMMNSRAESVFTKSIYRSAAGRRCLIPADGFYEWHARGRTRYPFYITLPAGRPFAFAGLWDAWTDRETGEEIKTCAIITARANPLVARIHNTTKRMPVMLHPDDELLWLARNTSRGRLRELLRPYDGELAAHSVSKLVTRRGANPNVPEAQAPFEYTELKELAAAT